MVKTDQDWNLYNVTYNLNDFFLLFLILRCYVLVVAAITFTKFYSARSDRVNIKINKKGE